MFSAVNWYAVSAVFIVLSAFVRLLYWIKGKEDLNNAIDEEDVKVLERQRDNDVTSLEEADDFWSKVRGDE